MKNHKILKISNFILIILIIDKICGLLLYDLYFKQSAGQDYSLNFALSKCKSDLIIIGNSRAQHHYNTRILTDSLKMSCYNAGLDGGHSIIMSYALIKIITERYKPKIIVLEFSPENIIQYPGDYDRLAILLPYYKEYPELRPFIYLKSPVEKVKMLSSIYPFNSNLINIIRYNTNTHAARKKDYEGFVPLEGKMSSYTLKDFNEFPSKSVIDNNMVNALKNIIYICKEKKIPLYILNSPVFQTCSDNNLLSINKLSIEIIKNNNTFYKDFTTDSTFIGQGELFKDWAHLNRDGANVYTSIVAKVLMNELVLY